MSDGLPKNQPAELACPRCGESIVWRACSQCGGLGEWQFVASSHCGVPQQGKFCSECGATLLAWVENCAFCAGRGWLAAEHVCSAADQPPGNPFRVDPATWPAPAPRGRSGRAASRGDQRAAGVCDPSSRACGRDGRGSGCRAERRCRRGTGCGRERGSSTPFWARYPGAEAQQPDESMDCDLVLAHFCPVDCQPGDHRHDQKVVSSGVCPSESVKVHLPATVTPAEAGVQWLCLDSRFRGNDMAELILLRALRGLRVWSGGV